MDIFCQIIEGKISSSKCYEDDIVIAIMDANPKRPGHLLIIPKRHYATVLDIDEKTESHVHEVAKKLIAKMESAYPGVKSIISIVNYGEEQKVKHYHLHLIPDYDEEAMPTLSQDEFCHLIKK